MNCWVARREKEFSFMGTRAALISRIPSRRFLNMLLLVTEQSAFKVEFLGCRAPMAWAGERCIMSPRKSTYPPRIYGVRSYTLTTCRDCLSAYGVNLDKIFICSTTHITS